jgi:hypothetical protein
MPRQSVTGAKYIALNPFVVSHSLCSFDAKKRQPLFKHARGKSAQREAIGARLAGRFQDRALFVETR